MMVDTYNCLHHMKLLFSSKTIVNCRFSSHIYHLLRKIYILAYYFNKYITFHAEYIKNRTFTSLNHFPDTYRNKICMIHYFKNCIFLQRLIKDYL